MNINTKNIPTDKLKPDFTRVFDYDLCVAQGGVAVDSTGSVHRVMCNDRKRGYTSDITTLRMNTNGINEWARYFRRRHGGSMPVDTESPSTTLHHPMLKDDDGLPITAPPPPVVKGHEAVHRGEGWASPKPATYAYLMYGEFELNPRWNFVENLAPQGAEGVYYIEYVPTKTELTMQEIADKFGIPVDSLRIQKGDA